MSRLEREEIYGIECKLRGVRAEGSEECSEFRNFLLIRLDGEGDELY